MPVYLYFLRIYFAGIFFPQIRKTVPATQVMCFAKLMFFVVIICMVDLSQSYFVWIVYVNSGQRAYVSSGSRFKGPAQNTIDPIGYFVFMRQGYVVQFSWLLRLFGKFAKTIVHVMYTFWAALNKFLRLSRFDLGICERTRTVVGGLL